MGGGSDILKTMKPDGLTVLQPSAVNDTTNCEDEENTSVPANMKL